MDNKCYLIIYDLRRPGIHYAALYDAIKSYNVWGKITESVWAIVSSDSANDIACNLHQYVDSNDRLMVIRSGKESTWYNAMANSEWLKINLVK